MMDTPALGFCFVTLFMFLFHYVPCALSNQASLSCDSVFECGNLTATFPFWGENRGEPCGHPLLKLGCDRVSNKTSINISNIFFNVLQIDNTFKTLKLVRQDYSVSLCSSLSFTKTMFPPKIFQLSPNYKNLTVFSNCDPRFHYLENFTCSNGGTGSVYHGEHYYHSCRTISNVIVPAGFMPEKEAWNLENVLRQGFEVKLKINERPCKQCLKTGGFCSFDKSANHFCCKEDFSFYPTRIKEFSGSVLGIKCMKTSSSDDGELLKSSTGAGPTSFNFLLTGSRALILIISLTLLILSMLIYFLNKIEALEHPRIENFEELIPLKRYNYAEVKEITNSFAQEIGRGGYGIVYEGNLCEGLKVAVKVLKESKKNGEDFINEVASMSRTSYIHIVSLLGFCYEGSKRAIIYEFVENGSLDKFITSQPSLRIDLRKMYDIALGVARGLQYLHYACKTRIVHFDIKPQNILLGKDLCPKISDFGLARLCGSKESILWMSEARGTIGYIAPEVFSRIYGKVSHKSDVYSYGMLVLEMMGARNRNSVSDNNSSSMYFPDWIYKGLEKGDCKSFLEDQITEDYEDEELAKKMILVGLSCIQVCPSDRPSMNRVVEMMEGSLSGLEAPPKYLLHLSASPMPPSVPEDKNPISSEESA
ncbi:Protein kinase superfamily protein [Raphanus sativus]|uniref:non-specific serine/threonine protein kinase n=1 Tax=Raphanus sativus TaxID=3726 RepID=A0A6J0LX17_RAPSA|nr:LEAF RUST 10 DISEASE-RESISTANCE LOCUS RECEPTOR-LIKE PROTEIN KINASE-like 2.3 [Raphanus sativus]KAJ4904849.1 Protein kinase superfamily protein [Raphanus sativus]